MPFLGKSPTAGFASIVKDDLTPNGSTTAFTLSKQVANANDIAVFLGNVRQEPTDAYTVAGTTLTMSAAPASGLNFYVLHIAGTHESSVVPADNTISTAKIQSSAITSAKIANNAVTSGKMFSTFENGIEFFETYRLSSTTSATSSNDFTQSFTLASNRSYGALVPGGTGMSYSSGIWTFPATGMYLLMCRLRFFADADIQYNNFTIRTTNDNFSSNDVESAEASASWGTHYSSTNLENMALDYVFDCENTSTHKFKMKYSSTGTVTVAGNTDANNTYVTVIRLGDT